MATKGHQVPVVPPQCCVYGSTRTAAKACSYHELLTTTTITSSTAFFLLDTSKTNDAPPHLPSCSCLLSASATYGTQRSWWCLWANVESVHRYTCRAGKPANSTLLGFPVRGWREGRRAGMKAEEQRTGMDNARGVSIFVLSIWRDALIISLAH